MKYKTSYASKKAVVKNLLFWKKVALLVISLLTVVGFLFLISSNAFRRVGKKAYYSVQRSLPGADRDITIKLSVPIHKQEHALSCEIATLKMVLDYYGHDVSESELLGHLMFATHEPRNKDDNTWADPNLGFVGDIDGSMPNSGYGVYEMPISYVGDIYRASGAYKNATVKQILEEVKNSHPVIIWGTTGKVRDISWKTPGGKDIHAVMGEHTKVVIGYSGTIENPRRIYLIDPVYGEISMSLEEFIEDWGYLGNRAVIVY